MNILKKISHIIDSINMALGKIAIIAIFLATIISAGNALFRYLFHMSSNGMLEVQWYLFAAVFLLASGYTYLKDQHIRIDILSGRFSPKAKAVLEIIGIVFFLFPAFTMLLYLTIGPAISSWQIWEMSPNPGGLPRAPIKALLPIGMFFLLLQGVSELCKAIITLCTPSNDNANPLEQQQKC
ncbi:TRAP transporter small permease subunit [Ignatzschineria rhizosphaerae]|uniref:TRAP transporter small permease protein n=1 Tax=Ignatzschineria rhizosphaerae TaxID=2923279 RepID=A0ABY3X340_9GAMM|nr:TRAP transporter small permease subunit [Ignatzschineria rhizosphaerae]UNM96680.1 TRAP transporter small permease subunit [Ignatzschineria rhizosphaerae]